ncbi:hypothetical protein CBL_13187 [Carabus blaptoides fortunei]
MENTVERKGGEKINLNIPCAAAIKKQFGGSIHRPGQKCEWYPRIKWIIQCCESVTTVTGTCVAQKLLVKMPRAVANVHCAQSRTTLVNIAPLNLNDEQRKATATEVTNCKRQATAVPDTGTELRRTMLLLSKYALLKFSIENQKERQAQAMTDDVLCKETNIELRIMGSIVALAWRHTSKPYLRATQNARCNLKQVTKKPARGGVKKYYRNAECLLI